MAEHDQPATDARHPAAAQTTPAIPLSAAVLLHAAVLALCALAVYTAKSVGAVDPSETHPEGNLPLAVIIALVVLAPLIGIRAQLAQRTFGKLVLALGLAYTFNVAFEPLMSPPLPEDVALSYQISWANAALLLMIVGWCLCLPRRCRPALSAAGLEIPVVVGAAGLCALGLALVLSVGRYYGADAGYTVTLILKCVQYGLICLIAASVSGARRVGAWLHAYVLLALIAALILSMLPAGEPTEAAHLLWRPLV